MCTHCRRPPPVEWSSCSVSDLNDGYSEGLDRCLFNEPTNVRAEFLIPSLWILSIPILGLWFSLVKLVYIKCNWCPIHCVLCDL